MPGACGRPECRGAGWLDRNGIPAVACRVCRPWLIGRVRSIEDYRADVARRASAKVIMT